MSRSRTKPAAAIRKFSMSIDFLCNDRTRPVSLCLDDSLLQVNGYPPRPVPQTADLALSTGLKHGVIEIEFLLLFVV